jgi:hypothetical protein
LLAAIPILAIAAGESHATGVTPQSLGNCADLPNPIYLQVGDTQVNLMKALGRKLRDNTPKQETLIWQSSGSCTNIAAFYNHTKNTLTTPAWSVIPAIADSGAWSQTDAPWTCVPPTGGVAIDIANSALFNEACANGEPHPADVAENTGPTQAYVLAVPELSTQTAITFEEAYFVFGFGADGGISPWTDPTQFFIRTSTKSTLLAWALQLTITDATKMQGVTFDASQSVVDALNGKAVTGDKSATYAGPTDNEKAIGILGAEVYDANRATLNILAYRAKDQWAAYYPDSTSTSRDKKNVRDGHYVVWSPTIYMNYPAAANVTDTQYIIDLIAGKTVTPEPNFDPSEVVARVGLVPLCAMKVTRMHEQAPLTGFTPPEDCTCKYESLVDTTSCVTCTGEGTACTRQDGSTQGVCHQSYCEVR